MVNKQKNRNEIKLEHGIKINAGFRQIVVSVFILIVFLVLPIYVMENNINIKETFFGETNKNPYSSEALSQRTGQVAGISTSSLENNKSTNNSNQLVTLPIINAEIDLSSFTGDSLLILIVGVIFITIAFFLFLYLILGKFNI